MTVADLSLDSALTHTLADAADEVTLARFQAHDLVVDSKPDATPVTDADTAVEDTLRDLLAAYRPDDLVSGEERGTSPGAVGQRVWVIDPIDGTKNFLRGLPVWATLITLVSNGKAVSCMISAPVLGQRWWAYASGGAYTDRGQGSQPITVSSVRSLADAYLSTTHLSTWAQFRSRQSYLALADACWENRAFGDFWHHCLVAEGAIDLAAEPIVSPWDIAPFQVLLPEAGGSFSDLSGGDRYDGGTALCSNGLLHARALDLLACHRDGEV